MKVSEFPDPLHTVVFGSRASLYYETATLDQSQNLGLALALSAPVELWTQDDVWQARVDTENEFRPEN